MCLRNGYNYRVNWISYFIMNEEKEIEELKSEIKSLVNLNNQYFKNILKLENTISDLKMVSVFEFLIIILFGMVIFL